MGTNTSGRRGSKGGEVHEMIMQRLKDAGAKGVLANELCRELGVENINRVLYFLNASDPVAEETVVELWRNPKTGREKKKKMIRLYYCSEELYGTIENQRGAESPRSR